MADFQYKGFKGSLEYQTDGCYFYGRVSLTRDTIRYQAETIEDLENTFKASVDNYLADCAALGIEPG